jgi:hypothetical protein
VNSLKSSLVSGVLTGRGSIFGWGLPASGTGGLLSGVPPGPMANQNPNRIQNKIKNKIKIKIKIKNKIKGDGQECPSHISLATED